MGIEVESMSLEHSEISYTLPAISLSLSQLL